MPLPAPVCAVLALVRTQPDPEFPVRLMLGLSAAERAEFLDLARAHGLTGWAHAVFRDEGLELPDDLADELRKEHQVQTARAVAASSAYETVSRVLSEANVDHIPLKGIRLIESLYTDPGARTFGDIDLLVREPDLELADAVLRRAGLDGAQGRVRERMQRYHHHHAYEIPGYIPWILELHWRLSSGYGSRADPALPWMESTPSREESCEHILKSTAQFHSLLVHAASHGYNLSLKWLVDLRLLLEEPTERPVSGLRLLELARVTRTTSPCAFALHLLHELTRTRGADVLCARMAELIPATRRSVLRAISRPEWFFSRGKMLRAKWPSHMLKVWLADTWMERLHVAKRAVRFKLHRDGLID